MNIKKKIGLAFALASAAVASPALADQITLDAGDVGQSFSLSYDGFADGGTIAGLTGTATFTLTGVTSTGYNFDYSVSNTSSGGVDSRIASFAFNVDPTISSASSTGTFNYSVLDSNYPNGIGTVDVCFKGGSSSACAGNSGGVLTGDTGTGTLTLGFSSPVSSITLSDFFNRYQSISGAGYVTSASGSGTITSSTSTTSSTTGGTDVPEPGLMGMFGAGIIGLALLRRRKRLVKAA
jgi:hypothetical protein